VVVVGGAAGMLSQRARQCSGVGGISRTGSAVCSYNLRWLRLYQAQSIAAAESEAVSGQIVLATLS
jgi:hypothetical protein